MIKSIDCAKSCQTVATPAPKEPTLKHFEILMPGEWVEAYGFKVINICDTPIYHLYICPPYPHHNLDSFHPEITFQSDDGGGIYYLDRGGFFKISKAGTTVFTRIDAEEFARLQNKNKPKPSNRLKELSSRV